MFRQDSKDCPRRRPCYCLALGPFLEKPPGQHLDKLLRAIPPNTIFHPAPHALPAHCGKNLAINITPAVEDPFVRAKEDFALVEKGAKSLSLQQYARWLSAPDIYLSGSSPLQLHQGWGFPCGSPSPKLTSPPPFPPKKSKKAPASRVSRTCLPIRRSTSLSSPSASPFRARRITVKGQKDAKVIELPDTNSRTMLLIEGDPISLASSPSMVPFREAYEGNHSKKSKARIPFLFLKFQKPPPKNKRKVSDQVETQGTPVRENGQQHENSRGVVPKSSDRTVTTDPADASEAEYPTKRQVYSIFKGRFTCLEYSCICL
ncbi:hypothetical protein BDK51DRAFT_29056 [Blyttiomyces helicus]|uniref:Uncharacterized protein n=1 Tax=Blyttiomyces helicus TaxID=388810 RepID=A0A4P9WGK9_9FUNG|nr:hypothetical protein BDK51DRAFT_29056 [Blyttiomyces helicus]|eukprot:RKO90518.1 hypothetical protein BDK51DRAFT_29056 [Blyttiomyces helicus]